MPVPTHFKFTVRGIFVGTPEEWSYSFKMSRKQGVDLDAELTDINAGNVTSAVTNFHASDTFGGEIQPTDWRAYVIGTDGKMQGNGPLIHTFTPPAAKGTGSSARMPPQICTVVTTVAANRGPARFGRFYLPAANKVVQADFRMSQANVTTMVGLVTTYLKAVSDAIDFVALGSSAGVNISPGPSGSPTGTQQDIDHVEIGRVYDTMRSRRTSLEEERVVGGHIDW